jgi:hypothetical protein
MGKCFVASSACIRPSSGLGFRVSGLGFMAKVSPILPRILRETLAMARMGVWGLGFRVDGADGGLGFRVHDLGRGWGFGG